MVIRSAICPKITFFQFSLTLIPLCSYNWGDFSQLLANNGTSDQPGHTWTILCRNARKSSYKSNKKEKRQKYWLFPVFLTFLAVINNFTSAYNTNKMIAVINNGNEVLLLGQRNQILHISINLHGLVIHP